LLTADLTVELSRDSWLRKRGSPEMAVAFTGEVAVQLRPQAEPRLEGTLTTIAERGSIRQFGKRFEPREGTVTLAGPPDSARVDLAAVYQIPSYSDPDNAEATIVLSVEGMQDDLSLTLSSEPPMETADIVSYIATGRPAGGSLALDDAGADGGGDGLAATGAGVALGQLLGPIERAAQQEAGLDVVEIRRDRIRAATLIAGKYLTPRLYAGIAQPITREEGDGLSQDDDFGSAVEIEYEAIRGLLLNLEGSDSGFRVFLRGQIAY
jgi:translocation and assembly module TamB